MKAEIVSIGTEILLGQITDTNASYLAAQLPLLGIDLYRITQVGDNRERLKDVLEQACGRSDIVITTGGLGPTEDDVTRDAIALLLGENMVTDPELEQWLREMFRRIGYKMPECNLKQAALIPSARAIHNSSGTAPGWWVEWREKLIIAMPGPPGEMHQMWETGVKPELGKRTGSEVILSRTIKTLGMTEAGVNEIVSKFLSSTNPTLGIYAKIDGIQLRLTSKDRDISRAGRRIADMEKQLTGILGDAIWGFDEDTLESLAGSLLRDRSLSLATMESCTGGLLSSMVTDVAGSSDYFRGGLVAYSAEMKSSFGVDSGLIERKGTVDPEVAEAMAESARRKLGADIGIGITGVAGPAEIEGKPVGTVYIAVSTEKKNKVFPNMFPPRRPEIKRRAVYFALFHLRRFLIDEL